MKDAHDAVEAKKEMERMMKEGFPEVKKDEESAETNNKEENNNEKERKAEEL